MSRSHHHPKLKPPPRPFFSCGMFRHCTQTVLSPTSTSPPTPSVTVVSAATPPPPPPPPPAGTSTSSSSSSSSTSQSFTQWRLFPLHHQHPHEPAEPRASLAAPDALTSSVDLAEALRAAEEQFSSGATLSALRLLEKSLAGESTGGPCTPAIMSGVVTALQNTATARPAAKVLLALLLAENNRWAAVEAGAVAAIVEAVAAAGGRAIATAERALAALELLCTVEEGAAEVRRHALAAAALAGAAEGMGGRGRECAIGVLAAVYGGENAAEAPAEVGRAVVAALQGECTSRGRRKGAQLLRALQGSGRLAVGAGDGY